MQFLSGLFGSTGPKVADALKSSDYTAMRSLLEKKTPLSMDEFSQICFHMPNLIYQAVDNYPDLAKTVPFSLLLALVRTNTHQHAAYHTRPAAFDITPSTEDVFIALVNAGAPIHGREPLTEYTLLHHALENGLSRAAEALLEHGIDQIAALRSGITALHMAAKNGQKFIKIIERLVKNRKLLDMPTAFGATPLHYGAKACCLFSVDALLEAGAKRDVKDHCGLTPLDIAKAVDKQFTVTKRLMRTNAGDALVKCNIERTISLLKAGDTISDDDAADSYAGNSTDPLMKLITQYPAAVHYFSDTLLVRLLDHSASPESCQVCMYLINMGIGLSGKHPKTGNTALDLALKNGCTDLARALIFRGASISLKDKQGQFRLDSRGLLESLEIVFSANHDELNSCFELDEAHYKELNVLKMPPEQLQSSINGVLENIKKYPEASPFIANVEIFINKVNNETPFKGAGKPGSQALKAFYKTIRDALFLVVREISSPDRPQNQIASMVKDIAVKLSAAHDDCATAYLETALDLYNTYVLNITPSMSSAIHEQLQALRGVLVVTLVEEPFVDQTQTVHALHYIKRKLGQRLSLKDYKAYMRDDVFVGNGFHLLIPPSEEGLYIHFKKRYTPSVIFEYVASLMKDLRYRNFYIDWAKNHLGSMVPGFDQYQRKKSQLLSEVIDVWGERRPEAECKIKALKEERRAEIIAWLFDDQFNPKVVPLVLSLYQMGVIKINNRNKNISRDIMSLILDKWCK